jgi:hypothetical protein
MEILILGITAVFALIILYMAFTEMLNFIQTHVPFVPTSKKDLIDMTKRVGVTADDLVLDLGSGNGKVLFAVEDITGARARGLQRAGWTQTYAKLRKFLTGSKVEFVSGNFFDQSWTEATVIYGYLYPFLMSQVGEKAREDCRPGTRVVVRDFPIPNLQLVESWETPTYHRMYLYIIE